MAEDLTIGLLRKAENRSFPGFQKDAESCWKGTFTFIQGADTQFGLIEEYIEKKPDYGWDKEIKLTKAAIKAINSMTPRPRFFVVCGDLVHDMPGREKRKPQVEDFYKTFRELHPDIPLVCVCGNHDVGNEPTYESVQDYTEKFGDDYFSFSCGGVLFIVLNSQFFFNSKHAKDLAQKQEEWLDEQLKEGKRVPYKHIIVFQHIPPFLERSDEKPNYFNLPLECRERLLQKFTDANVSAVFCGHWHGNTGGFYKNLEVVVTSAIGGQLRGDKSGYRVVTVKEEGVNHEYYAIEE